MLYIIYNIEVAIHRPIRRDDARTEAVARDTRSIYLTHTKYRETWCAPKSHRYAVTMSDRKRSRDCLLAPLLLFTPMHN